ncbi:porin family protein [Aequorivita capsosiphonis]|uniref:porin family protein n=1 Tax=Aequorivita capsosiphonis TaxID=487317 RepID=UPI00041C7AA7|nr:porin family protein [Aequorivita capsosiphonis]
MKKILLFIAVVALTCTTAQSQEIRLGAKLGLNVASLGGDSYGLGSLGSRTSFHLGALAEIPLKGNFALQPEILYSSEGSDFSFGSASNDIKLDYIRVPVLAKYYIIEGLSAELGPSFGVLVSAKAGDEDAKDFYKSFDAAIAVGATYRLNMGVFFSLRYNKGLLDVNDMDEDNYKNQSNVFQISAGYSF